MKGPAIFLAQFASDEAPFNSLDAITRYMGDLGYKGVQIPTWDGRLFDLAMAADSQDYVDEVNGHMRHQWRRSDRAFHAPAGPARRDASGL